MSSSAGYRFQVKNNGVQVEREPFVSPTAGGASSLVEPRRDGAILRIHVQPGASAEGLVGFHGGSLKAKVRAPATSGKANEALLRLLARELGMAPARLRLVSGATSRDKRVHFAGVMAEELRRRISSAMGC